METTRRCYRYALLPAPVQATALLQAADNARRYWNSLVATTRWAETQIRSGRAGSVVTEFGSVLAQKKMVGRAASKSPAEALAARIERVQKLATVIRAKKSGWRLSGIYRKRLAIEYAHEKIDMTRKIKGHAVSNSAAAALNIKFLDSTKAYIEGKREGPKFKRRGDSISLQMQIQHTSPLQDAAVNLERLAGEVCASVPFFLHRPIPEGATIKQVAVTIRGDKFYLILMLEAPQAVLARPFPLAAGRVAGIDPGLKCALSVSSLDGQYQRKLEPVLARDQGFLKRLARLQRKADRQRRAANPDCFATDRTPIRGKWPHKVTKNLERTLKQIAGMSEHIANARQDYYHQATNSLLENFDVVGIGTWRGHQTSLGQGKAKKAMRRKALDHSPSAFAAILKYKAEAAGKTVLAIDEAGTTRTCVDCGEVTGPKGIENLSIRNWTCSACGTNHDRDFSSAKAIAQRADIEKGAAVAQTVSLAPRGAKTRVGVNAASVRARCRPSLTREGGRPKRPSAAVRSSGAPDSLFEGPRLGQDGLALELPHYATGNGGPHAVCTAELVSL
jgi:IS605 OrfB family transposase